MEKETPDLFSEIALCGGGRRDAKGSSDLEGTLEGTLGGSGTWGSCGGRASPAPSPGREPGGPGHQRGAGSPPRARRAPGVPGEAQLCPWPRTGPSRVGGMCSQDF